METPLLRSCGLRPLSLGQGCLSGASAPGYVQMLTAHVVRQGYLSGASAFPEGSRGAPARSYTQVVAHPCGPLVAHLGACRRLSGAQPSPQIICSILGWRAGVMRSDSGGKRSDIESGTFLTVAPGHRSASTLCVECRRLDPSVVG